jgi:hypothetical protein
MTTSFSLASAGRAEALAFDGRPLLGSQGCTTMELVC